MAGLKSGITSVQDLLGKAKAGADLNYGSSGNGSASHLTVEMLKSAAGIKLTHVPFKGNADALMALQSGDIQLMSDAVPGAVGPIRTDKVKAIGIAEPAPLALPAGRADHRRARRRRRGRGGLDRPVGTGAHARAHPRSHQRRDHEILKDPQVLDKLKGLSFVPAKESRQELRPTSRLRTSSGTRSSRTPASRSNDAGARTPVARQSLPDRGRPARIMIMSGRDARGPNNHEMTRHWSGAPPATRTPANCPSGACARRPCGSHRGAAAPAPGRRTPR